VDYFESTPANHVLVRIRINELGSRSGVTSFQFHSSRFFSLLLPRPQTSHLSAKKFKMRAQQSLTIELFEITAQVRSTIAIISGGTQGLGLAIARRLARDGAAGMIISGRNAEKGEGAAENLRSIGTDCLFLKADVSTANDCYRLVDTALKRLGNVNGLENSAGIGDRGTLLDTSLELWDRQLNTNARGPFLLMQGVVRHLVETGQPGSIVNILSMVAHCGHSYLTPYSASKGALATLTKNVANAFAAKRIRCNGILTGWMDTPGESATQQKFHGVGEDWLAKAEAAQPMGQLVKPDQLAGLVAYLLSPESGVMTGALVDYDQHVAGAYPE
jgi:NAD(P)-dependent dehydrogenase (short-subunit alcohol dehydrogenase family)